MLIDLPLILDSGVYQVSIDAEEQKVTVTGSADSATLINKLIRSGKQAELWSPSSQKIEAKFIDGDNNQNQTQYLTNVSLNLGRDVEWASDWNFDHRGAETVIDGEFDQNLIAAAMQNIGLGEDGVTIGSHDNVENNMTPLSSLAGFHRSGAGFVGLGGHELGGYQDISTGFKTCVYNYDHPSNQQGYPADNYPPTAMMNINLQDTSTFDNKMINDNVKTNQPWMAYHNL